MLHHVRKLLCIAPDLVRIQTGSVRGAQENVERIRAAARALQTAVMERSLPVSETFSVWSEWVKQQGHQAALADCEIALKRSKQRRLDLDTSEALQEAELVN